MLVLLPTGENQGYVDKIFVGQSLSPYTAMGIEQIHDAAITMSAYTFDHIYASDLERAQDALQAVLRTIGGNPPWELVEELRERSGGSYEGRKYVDIRKGMSPKQYKVWERDPFESPLHGESLSEVQDRLSEWFKLIKAQLQENQDILIISHPDTIGVLIAMARGDDLFDACSLKIEHGMPYFYYGPFE